jgi:zinc transport system substrate-binding protein
MSRMNGRAVVKRRWGVLFYWIVSSCLLMSGCTRSLPEDQVSAERTPTVIASNYPLWYFASFLGGEEIEVIFPVPPAVDPSYWQPREKDVRQMQQATLVVLNGAGYEHWLPSVTLIERRVVETAQPFRSQWIEIQTEVTHTHGPEGEHSHTGWADHTWLDPALAMEQVDAIAEAMSQAFPEHEALIKNRREQLNASLRQLGQEIEQKLGGQPGRSLLASHPIYPYLGRRMGASVQSVMWEPGNTPDAAEREALEELLQQSPATVMLWESKPTQPTLDYLASQGVKAVVFDSCRQRPANGDYFDQMRANIDRLAKAFESQASEAAGTEAAGTGLQSR